jgi:CRP/FNR family transcriptional regulator, cyclic AMP receptor protein
MNEPTFEAALDLHTLLTTAGDGRTILKLRKKEIVYAQGDVADTLFYIQQGNIKLNALSESGREAVVAILRTGDFFGQHSMVGLEQRQSAASCLTDCTVTRLDKAVALGLVKQHPEFAALWMSFLLRRAVRLQQDLVDQFFHSSEERLARTLLMLADFGNGEREESVIPRISQETLAEMVGTTRSRVSMFMNEFRRLGFVDYNGEELRVRNSLFHVLRN